MTDQFVATFTGKLSSLGGWTIRPPARVEQGKTYQIERDDETGQVTITELVVTKTPVDALNE